MTSHSRIVGLQCGYKDGLCPDRLHDILRTIYSTLEPNTSAIVIARRNQGT